MTNISPMEKALVGRLLPVLTWRMRVVLTFTDGTSFERDKTYEVITATLRQRDGTVLMTTNLSGHSVPSWMRCHRGQR